MPLLSLCMIARDEEALLPDCLASVRGVVDEIILVDTGSRDRTREIARKAGAKVRERAWDEDFSAPRNRAIEEARGDWVLVLDADERLAPGAGPVLRRIAADRRADFDCGMLRLHNASRLDAKAEDVLAGRATLGGPQTVPRLLRNVDGLRYKGVVHESVRDWLVRRGSKLSLLPVDLIHLGAATAVRASRSKLERNVRLLHKLAAEDPGDPTAWGYLAQELIGHGQWDEAHAAVAEGWRRRDRCTPETRISILRVAVSRAMLQFRASDAAGLLETAEESLRIDGAHPDIQFALGGAHELLALGAASIEERRRHLAAAIAAFRGARALRDRPFAERFLDGAATWASATREGVALLLDGRPAEARAAFEAALADKPGHGEALLGRAEALLDEGRAAEALAAVEPMLGDRPDGWVLAAAIAGSLGGAGEMQALLAQAAARASTGFVSPHRRARFDSLRAAIRS